MGAKAITAIVRNSGLPEEYAKDRLEKLLEKSGFDPNNANLEDIREVLANLLQDLILESDEAH